jgi:hypothetical protein
VGRGKNYTEIIEKVEGILTLINTRYVSGEVPGNWLMLCVEELPTLVRGCSDLGYDIAKALLEIVMTGRKVKVGILLATQSMNVAETGFKGAKHIIPDSCAVINIKQQGDTRIYTLSVGNSPPKLIEIPNLLDFSRKSDSIEVNSELEFVH